MTTDRASIPHDYGRRLGALLPKHLLMSGLGVLALAPILWMLIASFHPASRVFAGPFSSDLTLNDYRAALASLPFARLLLNTMAMAAGVSLGQLLTSLLAAYAFSRWRFRGDRVIFLLVVATWLVPFQVTMLPNYVLLSHLGLLNTIAGVIVPQLSSAFGLLLLRQHLKAFPTELIEAARVDGRNSWSTLWTVIVPNLAPALVALEILLFVGAWNEYFWPLLVFRSQPAVLQLGLGNLLAQNDTNYGALMAAAGLATLPVIALYAILNRRVVNVFVRSGLR